VALSPVDKHLDLFFFFFFFFFLFSYHVFSFFAGCVAFLRSPPGDVFFSGFGLISTLRGCLAPAPRIHVFPPPIFFFSFSPVPLILLFGFLIRPVPPPQTYGADSYKIVPLPPGLLFLFFRLAPPCDSTM